MTNYSVTNGAQIACKCDRWPERLLQQGCLHDSCHRCDATTFKELENANHHIASLRSRNTSAVCIACHEALMQSVDGAKDKKGEAGKQFYLGSATVPRTSEGLLGCECCIDHSTSTPHRAAQYHCKDCSVNLLCYECKQSHDKLCGPMHRVTPLDENEEQTLPVDPWARIPAVLCPLHDSTCDRWCFKCDTAKCQECALQCAKKFHQICSSDELDLKSWVSQLNSSTVEIEEARCQFTHLKSVLELEHRADMEELKVRKRRIMDALDSVFSVAHKALERNFQDTCQWIANAGNFIDSAVHCSRLLTRQPLPSHGILMKCAQRAVNSHKRTAQRLMSRENFILEKRLSSTTLPEDLADVMKCWLGWSDVLDVHENNEIGQSTVFSDNSFRNKPKMPRYDIAATLCGHVLVAAGKCGLQELDSKGCLLDTWLPTSAFAGTGNYNSLTVNAGRNLEKVVSVDSLQDDRVVVGLQNACAVVLLKRGGNAGILEWHEQKRFELEQYVPFAVATRRNLLVVALGSVNEESQILLPGKHLAMFDISSGIRQASAELDFEIDSVAVSALKNTVVVASHYRVNVSERYNGQFVIESRSSDLQSRLWRVSRDKPILGLAASASRAVVYASVARERGRRVITLDAATGLTAKVAIADKCVSVRNDVAGVRNLEMKSLSQIGRGRIAETVPITAKMPVAVGRTGFSIDYCAQREHWLTSTTVFGKLSCSKSKTGLLVALGFDSKFVCRLSENVEQPPPKHSVFRFIEEVSSTVDCMFKDFFPVILVPYLMLLIWLLPVDDLQAVGLDTSRLMSSFISICAALLTGAIKNLLCVKSLTTKLLTIAFDLRPFCHLFTDFEQTSLKDCRRRAPYLTKTLITCVEFFSHVFLFFLALGVLILLYRSAYLNEMKEVSFDYKRTRDDLGDSFSQGVFRVVEEHIKNLEMACVQCYKREVKRCKAFSLA